MNNVINGYMHTYIQYIQTKKKTKQIKVPKNIIFFMQNNFFLFSFGVKCDLDVFQDTFSHQYLVHVFFSGWLLFKVSVFSQY